MTENDKLQVFEDQTIRTAWDEEKEEWYFSVVDVVVALTESPDYKTGRKYWNKLKQRLKEEGNELVTNCHQLKMKAADGKRRLTDVANAEQLLRIIQSMEDDMAEASRGMDFEEAARLRDQVVKLRAQVEGSSEDDVLKSLKKSARKGSAYGNRKHAAYGSSRSS